MARFKDSPHEDPDVVSPFFHICEDDRVLVGPLGRISIARGFQEIYDKMGRDTHIWQSEHPLALYCRICNAQIKKSASHEMIDGTTGETIAVYCNSCVDVEKTSESTERLAGYLTSCPLCGVENVAHRSDDGIECSDCGAFFNPAKHWAKASDGI